MMPGAESGCSANNGNVCQDVKEAACYGPTASCQIPSQQCCRMVQQRVCQQVPVRVPVMVNITVPGRVVPNRKCNTVDVEVPFCETVQETIKENKTYDRCEMEKKEHCVPFELPTFSVIKQDRAEQIDLRVSKCKKSVLEQEYCHVFPDAEVECREKLETRQYILNKVVCDREREAKICRTIPWSRCMAGSGQECEMVPRQRCVEGGCSNNPACGQCDKMRQEGLLQGGCPMQSSPPVGPLAPQIPAPSTCGNFFPKDLVGAFSPTSGAYSSTGGGAGAYSGTGGGAYSSTQMGGGTYSNTQMGGGTYSNTQMGGGGYSTAPANTVYSGSAQVTSQNFVPANTLPQDLGLGGGGSLPEIGERNI